MTLNNAKVLIVGSSLLEKKTIFNKLIEYNDPPKPSLLNRGVQVYPAELNAFTSINMWLCVDSEFDLEYYAKSHLAIVVVDARISDPNQEVERYASYVHNLVGSPIPIFVVYTHCDLEKPLEVSHQEKYVEVYPTSGVNIIKEPLIEIVKNL